MIEREGYKELKKTIRIFFALQRFPIMKEHCNIRNLRRVERRVQSMITVDPWLETG